MRGLMHLAWYWENNTPCDEWCTRYRYYHHIPKTCKALKGPFIHLFICTYDSRGCKAASTLSRHHGEYVFESPPSGTLKKIKLIYLGSLGQLGLKLIRGNVMESNWGLCDIDNSTHRVWNCVSTLCQHCISSTSQCVKRSFLLYFSLASFYFSCSSSCCFSYSSSL